ncbi:MAG: hypothetical protein V2A34_16030 [Lentisphaerota bacterium]
MSTPAEKVMVKAMGLPPSPRAFVAVKLIENLDEPDASPLSAKWKKRDTPALRGNGPWHG